MQQKPDIEAEITVERDKIPLSRINFTQDGDVHRRTLTSIPIQKPAYFPVAKRIHVKRKIRQTSLNRSRHSISFLIGLRVSKTISRHSGCKSISILQILYQQPMMLYNIFFDKHPHDTTNAV
jgi:hypothetical protein